MSTNIKIGEFKYYIWNLQENYIQTSTNMTSIGLDICEIVFDSIEFREK